MSDSDIILKVENLSKTYFSKHQPQRSIKDLFTFPFEQEGELTNKVEALKDVSFELKRGESLGVIGPNGAGKSTLLKILSGVISPTSGKVTINGRVLSVLDIGTGFHPDLTGRENVYLNGEILGMSRKEIDRKYKEIVEFSGIEEFISRPVKEYSSGMYLRLAFSIVVNLDADLILFDEVLSVGDTDFRLKVSKRIKRLAKAGKSIILVTHNMGDVVNICNTCIWLDKGFILIEGNAMTVVKEYSELAVSSQDDGMEEQTDDSQDERAEEQMGELVEKESASLQTVSDVIKFPKKEWPESKAPSNDKFKLLGISVVAEGKDIGSPIFMNDKIVIQMNVLRVGDTLSPLDIGFLLRSGTGEMIMGGTTLMIKGLSEKTLSQDYLSYSATIPENLLNAGIFSISLASVSAADGLTILGDDFVHFKVLFNEEEKNLPWFEQFPGVVRPLLDWKIETL